MTTRHPPHRVLHVIGSISSKRGGPSFVVRDLARGQAERGMIVHIATTDDDGPHDRTSLSSMPFMEGNVSYWMFPRQTKFYLLSLPLTRWLWKHTSDYDIVHIHALFCYPSVVGALFATLAQVPYIVRPLGTLNRWGMRNRRRWLKAVSYRLIEKHILGSAAAVHYASQQEALEAEQLGVTSNSVIIPNPVEIDVGERVRSDIVHDGRQTLLFLSRLDPGKGLDLLLPAFAQVRKHLPNTALVIAGEGKREFVGRLKHLSQELNIDSAISWVGQLLGESKSVALSGADIFVLPSYSESFGVAVLEAMAAGVPVIVSDQVAIHADISKAGAGLVCECTVDSLAKVVLELLRDRRLRATMAPHAKELAKKCSRQTVTDQLVAVYTEIRDQQKALALRP